MSISKTYDPKDVESKWYRYWLDNGFFKSVPDDREAFTIVIPPPNVTGVLHLGHTLNNTLQDVLIRRARMQGKNACWVPGTDHASIATEAKVVAMLKEKGINKNDLSREEFLEHAWEWKEKYGGIILQQLKKLGASCDWDRTRFTMEPDLYDSVIKVFVDLYKKGLIYRGVRMVNWDPKGLTALSDEEVVYKEVQSKLYYVRYQIEGAADEWITIATTRPETILGDTAVCVNPDDERYRHLKGKKVIIPLVNRAVPIIYDEYVDIEFGTGALKVTPAHDINDYELGMKHKLQTIDVLNENGTMSKAAQLYVGEDRFAVRKKIAKDLETSGNLVKVEELTNKVGFSERTDVVIEPKLSTQWFLNMEELAKPALENVLNNNIAFHPSKFRNVYRHWMENIKDWCISRQLWWGQRIPAWYLPNGEYIVAENEEQALKLAQEKTNDQSLTAADLRQDEDVLDTWFSSWLWPISVFNGINEPDNPELQYYYPTSVLVTGHDIIFFWVARMIMAGYEFKNEKPFHDVYFTGMVRDSQGRKMSKSLGNSPDLLDLIEKYSADGVRAGVLFSSPAGNDLLFDEKLCEQGRNFCNKIWNALRLVKGWKVEDTNNDKNNVAIKWFKTYIKHELTEGQKSFADFRISDALLNTYNLIWSEFCSWYLEMVKPEYGASIDKNTYDETINFFEILMQMAHPFMPFITEEVWQNLRNREKGASLMMTQLENVTYDRKSESMELIGMSHVKLVITTIRKIISDNNIPRNEPKILNIETEESREKYDRIEEYDPIIKKLGTISEIRLTNQLPDEGITFVVEGKRFSLLSDSLSIDIEVEKERIQQEIKYNKGFLNAVMKKLDNERFVQNAPADVIEKERKKKEDAEIRIKLLEESLEKLN